MQYAVPQFIDVEPKIIGPISVRQFVLMTIGLAIIFILYKSADFGLFIFLSVIVMGVVSVFAFVRVNGRAFHYFIVNMLETLKKPYLRVWKKEAFSVRKTEKKRKGGAEEKYTVNYIKVAREKQKSQSRISELSLLVDTGGYYKKS